MYMSNTITIPKIEYKRLKQIEQRFETMREAVAPTLFPEIPTEDVEGYAHPERIRRSLKNALKQYPVS